MQCSVKTPFKNYIWELWKIVQNSLDWEEMSCKCKAVMRGLLKPWWQQSWIPVIYTRFLPTLSACPCLLFFPGLQAPKRLNIDYYTQEGSMHLEMDYFLPSELREGWSCSWFGIFWHFSAFSTVRLQCGAVWPTQAHLPAGISSTWVHSGVCCCCHALHLVLLFRKC